MARPMASACTIGPPCAVCFQQCYQKQRACFTVYVALLCASLTGATVDDAGACRRVGGHVVCQPLAHRVMHLLGLRVKSGSLVCRGHVRMERGSAGLGGGGHVRVQGSPRDARCNSEKCSSWACSANAACGEAGAQARWHPSTLRPAAASQLLYSSSLCACSCLLQQCARPLALCPN